MILLVDGTNLIMRYAHAMMPPDTVGLAESSLDLQGMVSGVLSAATMAVIECASQTQSPYAIVALDTGKSWRREVYPEYKAQRTLTTTWWSAAFAKRLNTRGIRVATAPRYEADDVIATLAARHGSPETLYQTRVLSGDSDLLALSGPLVDVYQFGKGSEDRFVWRSDLWICNRYDIDKVEQLPKYKAIVGEPVDNLPGVRGLGPVKARKILRGEMFLTSAQQEEFERMLKLTMLSTNAPVEPIPLPSCRVGAAA